MRRDKMKKISAKKAYAVQLDWHTSCLHNGKTIKSMSSCSGIVFKVGKKEFSTLDEAKNYIDLK